MIFQHRQKLMPWDALAPQRRVMRMKVRRGVGASPLAPVKVGLCGQQRCGVPPLRLLPAAGHRQQLP
jgi:hypothetical protein